MTVEDVIERYEHMPRKRKLQWAGGLLLLLVILGVGANTIISGILSGRHNKPAATQNKQKPTGSPDAAGQALHGLDEAQFHYLMPKRDVDWMVDAAGGAYESDKGVAKYPLTFTSGGTVTVSQQAMPDNLGPRTSSNFMKFINDAKVARSQDSGDGTVYFLPALSNGAPANGSDTIIFATDKILLFGRSDRIVPFDRWVKLTAAMKPTDP